jgi:hypothetical protein
VTNEGGAWNMIEISPTETVGDFNPALAAGPDGTIHLVWNGDVPCGTSRCAEVFYTMLTDEGFAKEVNLSNTASSEEKRPDIALDQWGRALVTYQAEGNERDVIAFTWASRALTFSPPIAVDQSATGVDDRSPTVSVDPDSGLPSIAFERLFNGSDPLNVDIFRAHLDL